MSFHKQYILMVCRYYGATNTKGSRVSYKASVPGSKSTTRAFDHSFQNIDNMVANWIKVDTGIEPIGCVQLDRNSSGLIYEWDINLLEAIWNNPIARTKTITDKEPTLEYLQDFVGGLIEVVPLRDGSQLIVNEEGLMKELPHNQQASELAMRDIVGNALVLKGKGKLT